VEALTLEELTHLHYLLKKEKVEQERERRKTAAKASPKR
jgi:hypothetical protein